MFSGDSEQGVLRPYSVNGLLKSKTHTIHFSSFMLGWVIKLHTFQYVSMNFDATVCHFEGFTSKTPKQIVQCFGVSFLCYKKLVRWKPSTVPGEAGHAEVDAALKLLTSPEGANLRSEASGSAFECFIF